MSEELGRYLPFVPVVIAGGVIVWSLVSSFLQGQERTESRGTAQKVDSTKYQVHWGIMKEIDPIDSLYFDLSVARHTIEEGQYEKAKEWLGGDAALRELGRSVEGGFVGRDQADKVRKAIGQVAMFLTPSPSVGRVVDPQRALEILVDLQDDASELAYKAYVEEAKKRGMDPPQVPILAKIDAKFEPIRERKEAEWRAKGYPQGMIERALSWAEEYSIGMAAKISSDPEFRYRIEQELYPKSLDMAEKWITGFLQFVGG